MSGKPNIILCICDQLRAFETGCYGNTVIQTPAVDRLAKEGFRFETAISSFPVCMAARSVLLSGQYNRTCTAVPGNVSFMARPGEHAMPEYPEAGRPHLPQTTLPELLQSGGYHTRVIGKWHIHSWPHEVGFDNYLIPRVHHCHTGQSFTEDGGPEFVPEGYSVDFECDRVEQFLDTRKDNPDPFFLYYSISPPHCPVADAPEEFRTMYAPDQVPLRPNVDTSTALAEQDHWMKVYRHDFRYYSHRLPHTEVLPEGYGLRHLIAEYYGMTTWMDTAVDRMLRSLDKAGLAENTIVVFTSDHGDNLGSLGLVQKGGPNEESIRVPLIVRWPGLGAGDVTLRQPVAGLVDIAPTLLSLAGMDVPAHFHGCDLSPALREPEKAWGGSQAFVETGNGVAVRTDHWMCHVPFAEGRTLAEKPNMLFSMADDPYQMNNLAPKGLQVPAFTRLTDTIRAWDEAHAWMDAEKDADL
jgi:arylsulfatase A-like enzyme